MPVEKNGIVFDTAKDVRAESLDLGEPKKNKHGGKQQFFCWKGKSDKNVYVKLDKMSSPFGLKTSIDENKGTIMGLQLPIQIREEEDQRSANVAHFIREVEARACEEAKRRPEVFFGKSLSESEVETLLQVNMKNTLKRSMHANGWESEVLQPTMAVRKERNCGCEFKERAGIHRKQAAGACTQRRNE